jgi:hypothetical protein
VLRLGIVVAPCSAYLTQPDDELIEDCNQFLGPTQPGVTTPDPTEGAGATTAAAATPAPAPSAQSDAAAAGLIDYLLAP